ncbi:MAG: hypothetical protein MJ058_04215 [Akkermansia sp.]|nr:hypothetical protein [Akkermansia sp.]
MSQNGPELTEKSVVVLDAIVSRIPWIVETKVWRELESRAAIGRKTYGVPLCTHNGRDVSRDEREEILDALAYAMQDILEASDSGEAERESRAWGRLAAYVAVLQSGWEVLAR